MKIENVFSDVFVASYGRKLSYEEYESRMLESKWRKLPKARVDATKFGIGEKDDKCYVVIPKTQEDLNMLNAYIRRKLFYATDFFFAEDVGRAMLVNFDNDCDSCHVYDLADYTRTSEYVRLPYKIGETVYYISGCREHPIVRSATILNMTLCEGGILDLRVLNEDCEKFTNAIDIFYPSREEAEKAIKEGVR